MSNSIERNTRGICEVLFEELENLRNGKSTPQMARAKAALCASLVSTARLELDAERFSINQRSNNQLELEVRPLQLK